VKAAVLAIALAACGGAAGKATTPAASQPAGPTAYTPKQIAEKALPSVVLIKTNEVLGTGFVVWKDGRIATNLHVLAGARDATVTTTDGREFKQIEVLGVDPHHDLAVIRIPAKDLTPLPLGDSGAVKPGEHVVAIGNPLGLGNTVSDGLVSAIRQIDPSLTLLQVSAPIAAGSSGGPIFNERGEVIGVATLYSQEGQNLNFGVPVAYLRPLMLSEHPVPLAALAREADLGMFEHCSVDEVKLVITGLTDAISVGVPKFNANDHQGCFDTYQKAALDVVGKLKGCEQVRDVLLGGVTAANHEEDVGKKAWALRHAFDRVINAFDEIVEREKQTLEKKEN
jgi:hypothetical protein